MVALQKADHRDLELIAMVAISKLVHSAFHEAARLNGESPESADQRFLDWQIGPETIDPLK